jgi:putative ABC transport system permease protein
MSRLLGDTRREVDEEVRFHLEMRASELAEMGLDDEAARIEAETKFGAVGRYAAACRRIDRRIRRNRKRGEAMFRVRDDIRFAFRLLGRSPGFTSVVVLTLALGIGANVAIFSVVRGVILRPLPYVEQDRVVRVYGEWRGERNVTVSHYDMKDLRERSETLTDLAVHQFADGTLLLDEPVRINGARITSNWFSLLGVQPAVGRFFVAEEDIEEGPRSMILSWQTWQDRFGGDPDVVGRTVTFEGSAVPVVGVAPEGFVSPLGEPQYWMNSPGLYGRGTHIFRALARLADGVNLGEAQAEAAVIAAALEKEYPETNTNGKFELVPVAESITGSTRPVLAVLFAAVSVVLLIAAANVANLLLSRAAVRQREIAIRSAVGGGRRRIVGQLLTESLVLALVGAVLGVLLARPATAALLALAGDTLPRAGEVELDGMVLAFALGVAVLTALLFGLAPAIHATATDLAQTLRESGRSVGGGGGQRSLRSALVVAQTALSLMLLIGAGLFVRSLWHLQSIDPGIRTEGLITFAIAPSEEQYPDGPAVTEYYARVLENLQRIPGVESIGGANQIPLSGEYWGNSFKRDDLPEPEPGKVPSGQSINVTPDFFATMGIPVLRGRVFTDMDDSTSLQVAVINEAAAKRYWPGEDPIGKHVTSNGPSRQIVGIVADVRDVSASEDPAPALYTAFDQQTAFWMRRGLRMVLRTSGDPMSYVAAAREAVWKVDPAVALTDIQTVEAMASTDVAAPRFRAILLALFAGIAALLSAIGIGGVMAYNVSQRTHEIGVRSALGASESSIVRFVVGEGIRLNLIGVVIGLFGAWGVSRLLAGLLFGVEPVDLITYAGVAALLVGSAVLATLVPAWRASRIDPVEALRAD